MNERELLERRLTRALERVRILEAMVESKTRELFMDQERLRRSYQQLNVIVETLTVGVLVLDSDFKITICNRAAAKLIEVGPDQVLGRDLRTVFFPEVLGRAETLEALLAFPEISGEIVLERAGHCSIGIASAPLRHDGSGPIEGVVLSLADLSKRKSLERELVQAQKLESIGRLSAGIAHELNTPIQYVRDNTMFLRDQFEIVSTMLREAQRVIGELGSAHATTTSLSLKDKFEIADVDYVMSEVPLALDQTLEGAESVARIVRSLKDFAHPGMERKSAIDVNQALQSTSIVTKNEWKYTADVEYVLAADLPRIQGFGGELNQVFLNLIVNAAHAIGDATDEGRKGKGKITLKTQRDGGGVRVSISDTGTGIPEEIRQKIFDPFFTTKPIGKGTGQGLSLAYGTVVEKHDGKIWFDSELGKGTTFHLWIPLGEACGIEESAPTPIPASA